MENVIYLEAAFDLHAQLLHCLDDYLRRCVSEGHMLSSKCRQVRDIARKSGLSELRAMLAATEHLLAA